MSEAPQQGSATSDSTRGRLAHGTLRGIVAAMAMTGMRSFTVSLHLVQEAPPQAIARQKVHGVLRIVPKGFRRAVQELIHWSYGAVGGGAFALLPAKVRMRAGAGPLYGIVLWVGFELGVAPVLGLSQAKKPRPIEWVALAADHALYGLVLSETRRRPRE